MHRADCRSRMYTWLDASLSVEIDREARRALPPRDRPRSANCPAKAETTRYRPFAIANDLIIFALSDTRRILRFENRRSSRISVNYLAAVYYKSANLT